MKKRREREREAILLKSSFKKKRPKNSIDLYGVYKTKKVGQNE